MWSLVSAIAQGAVSALLAPIVAWFKDRQLVQQGKAQQVASDDAQTVKDDRDASEIDEADSVLSDAALDARLRKPPTDSK